jgi:hypothetical protein
MDGEAFLELFTAIRADLVETTNLLNKVASRLFALEQHVYARHPPLNNCSKCGKRIIGTMLACPQCGAKLSRTSMA